MVFRLSLTITKKISVIGKTGGTLHARFKIRPETLHTHRFLTFREQSDSSVRVCRATLYPLKPPAHLFAKGG